jgi:hypothetical protein
MGLLFDENGLSFCDYYGQSNKLKNAISCEQIFLQHASAASYC